MGNCMGRQNNAVEVMPPATSAGVVDEVAAAREAAAAAGGGKAPRADEAPLAGDEGVSLLGAPEMAGGSPELLAIAGAAQVAAAVAAPLLPVPPGSADVATEPPLLPPSPPPSSPPSPIGLLPPSPIGSSGGGGMDEEDAAITIQRWWCGSRDQSLASLCLAFQSVGLTASWAKTVPFDELALCLQRDDLLQVISMLLRRLTDGQPVYRHGRSTDSEDDEEDEDDELMKEAIGLMTEPSRVLLSAYVVCTHPEVVFAESTLRSGTRQEQNLRTAANMFVSALEMLCQSVVEGAAAASVGDVGDAASRKEEQAVLVERFQTVWGEYQARFTAWKQSSTAFLTDELVAAYLELEAAKLAADGTEAGLVTSIGALPSLDENDDMLDDRSLEDDIDTDDGNGSDDGEGTEGEGPDGPEGCLDEIEARQNTIRQAIARNGTAAELKLQQALDQYSSTQHVRLQVLATCYLLAACSGSTWL